MFDINKCYDCFASEPNSAYFWSGLGEDGQDIAAQVAQENGGTTLEMLMDKNKDKLISAGFPYDEDLGGFYFSKENAQDWQTISQAYAEQASGDVHAVLGENVREGSVWNTKELPALKDNDNVDRVISVDPKTGKEKYVLLDKNSNDTSFEYGHKPFPTEKEAQSSDIERGFKPTENVDDSKGDNVYGKKPPEESQNVSDTLDITRGKLPEKAGGEDSRAPASSSDNPDNQISASSNSAKAADDASKVASESAVPKTNGMNM